MKTTAQENRLAKMVKAISKKVCEELITEDVANQLAYDLTRRNQNPDHHDDFMEACGIVEEKVRKALGVKRVSL